MSKAVEEYLALKIEQRKEKDAFRLFRINEDAVDFCSNDYLGLAKDIDIAEQTHKDIDNYLRSKNGSTGARTITGTSKEILALEAQLASFHYAEAALMYNSGYTANLGLFSALPYRGDTVLYDELIHASIRDGLNMSKAKSYSFKHNDLNDLEQRLQRAEGRMYVAVESVYSMDGDQAPLKQLAALCEKYQAALIVDEAHSNGIFGKQGRGLVSEIGIEKKVFARVMTFGKALGNHGAVVIGSQDLKDFLINYSRSFIYTTAPSPHQVFSVKNAYDKLSMSNDKTIKLRKLVVLFKDKVKEFESLEVIPSESPIQCVLIAGNSKVKAICQQVQEDGFDIRPIVAPTVPEGKERIRICIHSFNTEQEIIGLLDSINQHLENYGE